MFSDKLKESIKENLKINLKDKLAVLNWSMRKEDKRFLKIDKNNNTKALIEYTDDETFSFGEDRVSKTEENDIEYFNIRSNLIERDNRLLMQEEDYKNTNKSMAKNINQGLSEDSLEDIFNDKRNSKNGNKEKMTEKNENNKKDNKKGNDKKKIENLVFFIIIAIITVFAINIIWEGNDVEDQKIIDDGKQLAHSEALTASTSITYNETEEKLKQILSKIEGVGETDVYISYSETEEVIAMYNETTTSSMTEETDDSGGVRKIEETDSQKDVIYEEDSGIKTPVTQKIIEPKIEGAIITAKGASDVTIKNNIIQAVEAVTGLPTHKIQVFTMN